MSKLYLFLAFVCLSVLLVLGLVAPNSSMMWLASTSPVFTAVRGGMVLILLGLLVTNPPRNVYFRVIAGTASLLLISWCLNSFYKNQLQLVDFLSLMPAGIAAGIAALEPDYEHAAESKTTA